MADVDGGGKRAAEKSGKKGGESVDGEGGAGGVAVAGGFGAFEILEGADDVEEGHGEDDGEEGPGAFALEKGEEFIESGMRKIEAEGGSGHRWRGGGEAEAVESPGDESAEKNCGESCRNSAREANFSGVGEKDEEHGKEGDGGVGINFKNERHGDEGEGDTRERGEEGGAGEPAAEGISEEGAEEFENSTDPAGEDASAPDEVGVVGFLPEWTHDEEEVGHEADGVDTEGEGGDIGATGAKGEATTLPGIEEISDEDGEGGGGQDMGDDDFNGNTADGRDEGENEEEEEKVVDEKTDEAIEVSSYEPA